MLVYIAYMAPAYYFAQLVDLATLGMWIAMFMVYLYDHRINTRRRLDSSCL